MSDVQAMLDSLRSSVTTKPADLRSLLFSSGIGEGTMQSLWGDEAALAKRVREKFPGATPVQYRDSEGNKVWGLRMPDDESLPEEYRGRVASLNPEGAQAMDVGRFIAELAPNMLAGGLVGGARSLGAGMLRQAGGAVAAEMGKNVLGGNPQDPASIAIEGLLGAGGEAGERGVRALYRNTLGRGAMEGAGREALEQAYPGMGINDAVTPASARRLGKNLDAVDAQRRANDRVIPFDKVDEGQLRLQQEMATKAAANNARLSRQQLEDPATFTADVTRGENAAARQEIMEKRYPEAFSDIRGDANAMINRTNERLGQIRQKMRERYGTEDVPGRFSEVEGRIETRKNVEGEIEEVPLGPESALFGAREYAPGKLRQMLVKGLDKGDLSPAGVLNDARVARAFEEMQKPSQSGAQFLQLRNALKDIGSGDGPDAVVASRMKKNLDDVIIGAERYSPEMAEALRAQLLLEQDWAKMLGATGRTRNDAIDRKLQRIFDPTTERQDLGKEFVEAILTQQGRTKQGARDFTNRVMEMADQVFDGDELKLFKDQYRSLILGGVLQGKEGVDNLLTNQAVMAKRIERAATRNSDMYEILTGAGFSHAELRALKDFGEIMSKTKARPGQKPLQAALATASGGRSVIGSQGINAMGVIERAFQGLFFRHQLKEAGELGANGLLQRPGGRFGGAISAQMNGQDDDPRALLNAMRDQYGRER